MTRYVPTTREAALAIRAAHRDLVVYAVASPSGTEAIERNFAETWWALPGAKHPILRQRTSWEPEYDDGAIGSYRRTNVVEEQWLCFEDRPTLSAKSVDPRPTVLADVPLERLIQLREDIATEITARRAALLQQVARIEALVQG